MTIPTRIRPFLETPRFADEVAQLRAQQLNIITMAVLVLSLVALPVLFLSFVVTGELTAGSDVFVLLGITLVVRFLLYRRQLKAAAAVFVGGSWLLLAYYSLTLQGLYSSQFILMPVIVLVTAIILGPRPAMAVAGASIVLGGVLYFRGSTEPLSPLNMLVLMAFVLILTAVIAYAVLRSLFAALMQVRTANAELRAQQAAVEQQIASRTRTLETILTLGRNLSMILDPDTLLREIVEQVRAAFDYYYTQIYLLDPAGTTLSLTAGTGPTGQKLLVAGHRLPIGEGLVGQAAQENRPVLEPDVASNPQWLPNPLLPETRAEAAIPIAVGSRVLGVLDVQHHAAEGLTAEDVNVLQAMANQAAIALQNANLYAAAEKRARREAQINFLNAQIQQTSDLAAVLQIAAEGLGKVLPTKSATVYLHPAGESDNGRPEARK